MRDMARDPDDWRPLISGAFSELPGLLLELTRPVGRDGVCRIQATLRQLESAESIGSDRLFRF